MVVVRKNGELEHRVDLFDTQSPIVTELPVNAKKDFNGQFKNLTKSDFFDLFNSGGYPYIPN